MRILPSLRRSCAGPRACAGRGSTLQVRVGTRSHSSSDRSRVALRTFTPRRVHQDVDPAERAGDRFDRVRHALRRRTSMANVSARTPSATAPFGFPEAPGVRAHSARSHPAFASPSAIARPSPFDAPVTSAAFPVRSNNPAPHVAHLTPPGISDDLFVPPDLLHPSAEPDRPFSRIYRAPHTFRQNFRFCRRAGSSPPAVDPSEHVHQVRHPPAARVPRTARRAGAGTVRHQRPADPSISSPRDRLIPFAGARSASFGNSSYTRSRFQYPSARELRAISRFPPGEIGKDPQVVGHVRHPRGGRPRTAECR